jgi:PAS domain S-box-containing protein
MALRLLSRMQRFDGNNVSINKALRILHLEDEPDFSDLVRSLLEREGFHVELVRVDTLVDFQKALATQSFDAVLADYLLPTCNGIEALRQTRKQHPEIPFLLVSGTIGEQAAIESLKSGATDYVLKLWPERLVPAVKRAVREVEERRQRQQIETELFRREKYFRALIENALDIVTVLNREGIYLYNSPSLKRVLGYEPNELAGRSALGFIHSEDLALAREVFEEALKHPERPVRVEFRFRHQDGTWHELEAVGQSHLDDPAIGGIVINSRDISDRKRAQTELHERENELRQAQKMEAIGQLAGGVAHDFNNILTVIHGHASLLMAKAKLSGDNARSAQQITQAADRASALTRQLLAFSRRQVIQLRPLDLNETILAMSKMLGRVLGEDIAVQLKYLPEPALIHGDPGLIDQVLLNLAVNSRDAMPKGGVLQIAVEHARIGPSQMAHQPESCAGRFICLTVSDTGCGIAPENLRRIFEPFFTTKELGRGTGLGLATAYGIIKQHHGWIDAQSEVGRGTTIRVFLPCISQPAQTAEQLDLNGAVRGGKETILVVEDEGPVRELVCNLLEGYGYTVVPAESGSKALQVWQQSGGRIDLVLTDLVMPDRMSGRELAERFWAERPGLKVIFTSGYTEDVVGKDLVDRRGLNFLQKPYQPDKLAATVRDCLDAKN